MIRFWKHYVVFRTPPSASSQIIHYLQTILRLLLKLAIFALFAFMIINVVNLFTFRRFRPEKMSLIVNTIVTNGSFPGAFPYYYTPHGESFAHVRKKSEQTSPKIWTRISNEVFVYSAYLDTRNFSTGSHMQNNSKAIISSRSRDETHERANSTENNNETVDSDKLTSSPILVRIVGIKAVPPLREFIKTDILNWFRMKHEMEYSHKYECTLFFNLKENGKLKAIPSSRVTYTVIEEGVKVYAGCYFNCYFDAVLLRNLSFPGDIHNLQISFYPKDVADYPTKLIRVGTQMMTIKHENNASTNNNNIYFHVRRLATCVRPLFGPFDDVDKVIQFISYYRSVGVMQFNFYLMSASLRVRKFLMGLSQESGPQLRVFLHEWNVPTGNTSELWDYGSLAALNDCLFANIDQEYVVFVDIDEFIVPQEQQDYGSDDSLWRIIDSYNKSKTFQYLIRNTFFCQEFCATDGTNEKETRRQLFPELERTLKLKSFTFVGNANANADNENEMTELPIFQCFVRTKRIWSVALRSKYIVNPRKVLAVGHHLVTKYVDRKTDFRFASYSVNVSPSLAIMNHYRECTSISSRKHPILSRSREVDKTILRFRDKVLLHANKYMALAKATEK